MWTEEAADYSRIFTNLLPRIKWHLGGNSGAATPTFPYWSQVMNSWHSMLLCWDKYPQLWEGWSASANQRPWIWINWPMRSSRLMTKTRSALLSRCLAHFRCGLSLSRQSRVKWNMIVWIVSFMSQLIHETEYLKVRSELLRAKLVRNF